MPLHPLTILLISFGLREPGVNASGVGGCPLPGGSHMDELAARRKLKFSSNGSFKRRKQPKYAHMSLSREIEAGK